MRERRRKFAHQGEAFHAGQFHTLELMIQLGPLSLANVDAGSDVAEECAVHLEARRSRIEQPAILTVLAAQTILDREWFSLAKGSAANFEAVRQVLRMNPFQPSLAQLLIHGPAGEFQPALVEENALLVLTRHPDHDGGHVRHGPKPRFTLPQASSATFRSVMSRVTPRRQPAWPCRSTSMRPYPATHLIFPSAVLIRYSL